jgi:hypothetical protein
VPAASDALCRMAARMLKQRAALGGCPAACLWGRTATAGPPASGCSWLGWLWAVPAAPAAPTTGCRNPPPAAPASARGRRRGWQSRGRPCWRQPAAGRHRQQRRRRRRWCGRGRGPARGGGPPAPQSWAPRKRTCCAGGCARCCWPAARSAAARWGRRPRRAPPCWGRPPGPHSQAQAVGPPVPPRHRAGRLLAAPSAARGMGTLATSGRVPPAAAHE